ncbi:phosphatidate cytidylyltransferase [Allobranchiibius huperziae]|uniref:Phosphatidate cytidylyltransferase n=1 Tax=Allobranchiibius huperziae TaxID=1874116 RepID=A0A853DA73_9MICO|nr:phosphatidate cytidylyltransferase [Allobranchiibius huperziae]NYJ74142.1 phosphatidate cytidylyltransferase [Allobranchiibius huperziae]
MPDQSPPPGPLTRRDARAGRSDAAPVGATADKSNPTPRAGRNLYAAVGVGVLLGVLVLASLFIRKEFFVALATLASVVGVWELLRAMQHGRIYPPAVPTLVAAAAVPVIAYQWGPVALASSVVLAVLVVVVWRSFGDEESAVQDAAGGTFVVLYVPALVGFAMLLLDEHDGPLRIVTFVLVTIASDVGGYAVGVVFGKHPMAPSVSPKKSWEGFGGSVACCILAGALSVALLLDGRWWIGALLGALAVVTATVGDLCESMIKRDLGIKDMSNLIPGHGGLMDRLDSLLITVPVVWAILTPFVS